MAAESVVRGAGVGVTGGGVLVVVQAVVRAAASAERESRRGMTFDTCGGSSGAGGERRWSGSGRPVSRVLSDVAIRTVIYLGARSLVLSSSLPAASWSRRAASRRLFGLAPAGVYPATPVARRAVGSYPTISPLPAQCGSRRCIFCGTFRRLPPREVTGAQALPGGLPCGARTFLAEHEAPRDRPADRTHREI